MTQIEEFKSKTIIMQHCIESHMNNGGPATGFKLLMTSKLSERFQFIPLIQRKKSTNSFSLLFDLVKQIRSIKPTIVHIRGLQSPGFIGLLAARLAGCKKVIVSVHGSSTDSLRIGRLKLFLYKNIIEPFTLRNADLVYCVCDYAAKRSYIKQNTKNLYGYIHNAAPDFSNENFELVRRDIRKELKIDPDEVIVTYVGRIVLDKGLEDLANAIKILNKTQELRIRYLFVGEGDYLPLLKTKLKDEDNLNKVIFLGKRSDVKDILIGSDIFVFPTLHENLSNSLLEACAAGLAIIATSVGGNPEVIEHNITGLLVPSKHPVALSESIFKLVLNSEMRKCLGENAKENIRVNFNQDVIFDQLGSAYDSLLNNIE